MRSAFLAAQLLAVSAGAQVTTAQYGNDRQGFVPESALTARNVTPTLFGKVATFSVDGDVYAQPLYLPRVTIESRGARNVLFVATEQGSVYAFDTDGVADRPLWHRTLVDSSSGSWPVSYRDVRCPFIRPAISITPAPVIDAANNTLFVLVRSKEKEKSGRFRFVQRLHALDVRNGRDKIAPREISAAVAGTGAGAQNGSITFDPLLENPRAALLLTHGIVYAAWASSCDVRPYHGWIMAYDAASLTQRGVFITTSSGSDGGIWQGDAGLAADSEGYAYAVTGNGDFDEVPPVRNYGNSILKLSLTGETLNVRDYFTPSDQAALNAVDLDLGSGGPVLLPDQQGAHRHLLIVSSKKGTTYLIDRDAMGRFRPGANAHAVQTIQTSDGGFGAAAFWNHRLYLWGSNSQLKSYLLENGRLSPTPQIGPTVSADPGATPVVSANAAREGIVWAIETRTWRGADRPAILHAYDAMDVRRELYNSEQAANGRDRAGLAVRFAMPTIAGGRVFVGTKGEVDVYGLFSSPTPGIRAIVDAFSNHRIVAIAEDHGLTQAGDFYIALVRDPSFQSAVNDIVIEFASRQSQRLLDRYIVTGDSVSNDTLQTIWRNTTKVASWEFPIYERWLKAIRTVNLSLSPTRRIRVLAADTEVRWEDLRTHDDWTKLGDNNLSFARVITSDVLAKNRKALVVLGSNHLARSGARDGSPNTTTRVEVQDPGAMYVVWLYNGRPGGPAADQRIGQEGWASPSVVPLRATWAGAIPAGNAKLQDLADALLYLGPSKSLKREARPASDFDADYRQELDRRSWIEWSDSARARTFLNLPGTSAAGSITEFEIPSRSYRRARQIWVYTPPDYARTCRDGCNLLLAFDGQEYLTTMRLPIILDSLVGIGRIPPTIAVLIANGSSTERLQDLANRATFADFVGNELFPWVRTRFPVTRDAARTLVTGSSAGGLASAYLALKHPDLIGNVLSQSGAFWRGSEASNSPPFEWLTDQFSAVPKLSVRFFLDVGSVESAGALGGAAPSILAANRHLRDTLLGKGYSVIYTEVDHGEHSPESWRSRLPIGIASLFGK